VEIRVANLTLQLAILQRRLWTTLWTKNFHSGKRLVIEQGSTVFAKEQGKLIVQIQ
jgi:hypothetical protein